MSLAIGVTSGTADQVTVQSDNATSDLDVTVTQIDKDNASPPVITTVRTNTNITGTTETKVTTDPAANHEAIIAHLSITNKHATNTQNVVIRVKLGAGTARQITGGAIPLKPGDTLTRNADGTIFHYDASMGVYTALAIALSRTVLTSGSGTYVPPSGCRSINVRLFAGGGAGGGGASTAAQAAEGAGGGSSSYCEKLISPPAASYSYAIGAGGTAGTAGNNPGNNGADTTFGSLTAKGGTGGAGMAAGTTAASSSLGGAGGVAGSGGDINMPGQPGAMGVRTSGTVGTSGAGAPSALAGGGNGLIAQGTGVSAVANSGAGGGGGNTLNGGAATAGGAGGSGVGIIEEWF